MTVRESSVGCRQAGSPCNTEHRGSRDANLSPLAYLTYPEVGCSGVDHLSGARRQAVEERPQ